MQILNKNDKITIYGILNIKNHKKTNNIDIFVDNKSIKNVGEYLYKWLFKQYEKFDYCWDDVKLEKKTTKVVSNNNEINKNSKFKIYGYVEDCGGIPLENGKKYSFYTNEVFMEDLIETIEKLFEKYIVDFDTDENGIKFIITKMEVIE